jgi:hypothetical protein
MRRLALAAALTLLALRVDAHPSVSVVIDSKGNIYYSDLKQVWRVAPGGATSVVVPNVHAHELYLDSHDNLYGEHLWYEGDATKKFDHYFWRRSPEGKIDRIVAAHETFQNERDPSLVRDRAGNEYWADRTRKAIMKGSTVLAPGPFRDIRWLMATPEGTVYFVDALDLVRVTPDGRASVIARGLSTENMFDNSGVHNQIMGLWTDRAGNVYAADSKDNVVKRVTPGGAVSVVAKSHWPWEVSGGAFAPNGDLWLLEFRLYDARVRRIPR